MISHEQRERMDAAVSVIREVYAYVDRQIQDETDSIASQIHDALRQSGCSSAQARRKLADCLFSDIRRQSLGYTFVSADSSFSDLAVSLMN